MFFKRNSNNGLSLVEVLIATSIILAFFLALITVYNSYLKLAKTNINSVKAIFLAEEGIEAIKILRDSSWSNEIVPLTSGTNYYLAFTGGRWDTTTSNIYIDANFERKLSFSNVNRDAVTDDIVTSGGILDPNTRLLTVTVSWNNRGATSTKVLSTYITNLFSN